MRELFPKYKRPQSRDTVNFNGSAVNLADDVTYRYSPVSVLFAPSTVQAVNRQMKLSKKAFHFILYVTHSGGTGSNEPTILRVENVTKGTFADFDVTIDFTTGINAFWTEAFLECDRDDNIELQIVTPIYVTNPPNQTFGLHLSF